MLKKRTKKEDSEDEEEEFDLMKEARKNAGIRLREEERNGKVQVNNKASMDNGSKSMNNKLKAMLDPATQKLFSMLPPPKESDGGQTLTSALRDADTKVNLIESKQARSFLDQADDEDEEEEV